ncbi:hypothetical protein [Plantactinospora siamensis]|uniref:hypothetical protein n=1 Tax=Plantactinospora siamensis TaxID=555372 RepID=UPI00367213DC
MGEFDGLAQKRVQFLVSQVFLGKDLLHGGGLEASDHLLAGAVAAGSTIDMMSCSARRTADPARLE